MPFFTERNHLRKEKEKTYSINPYAYNLILDLCKEYFINLSWLFSTYCQEDMAYIVDYNEYELIKDLKFEIPSLIKDDDIFRPKIIHNAFDGDTIDDYDQYSILDLVEYIFARCKDYQNNWYHNYFNHFHIVFTKTKKTRNEFKNRLNALFEKLGLLYVLKGNGEIERIVSNESILNKLKEVTRDSLDCSLKELINQALSLYLKPDSSNIQLSLEKIWDAFERIKTIYPNLDKKESSNQLIDVISTGNENYKKLLRNEFDQLTTIGNEYRIRHHETNKIEITDIRHKEYLFNRCVSLLLQCLQFIKD